MGLAKFTLYKHVKVTVEGKVVWRYKRAVIGANGRIVPDQVYMDRQGTQEKHPEGEYNLLDPAGKWIPVGPSPIQALAERHRRLQWYDTARDDDPAPTTPTPGRKKITEARDTYFKNLENQGKSRKTLAAYGTAVNEFIQSCKKSLVEEVNRQDMLDFMGWLNKQPVPVRIHGNPERTHSNKVGHVVIFLKSCGITGLIKKSEYPQYAEKTVTSHTDEELDHLYSKADPEQRFLLDLGLGSGLRDGELSHLEYSDLVGNLIEVKRKPHLDWRPKQHHCRKVPINQALVDAIRARGQGRSGLVFRNGNGRPEAHLLRLLQKLTEGAQFHTELHRLRKTYATRRAMAGMPIAVLQKRLGHKKPETTIRYLSDVELQDGQMAAIDEKVTFAPGPKLVKEIA